MDNDNHLPILNLTYDNIMEEFHKYVADEGPKLETPEEVAKTVLPLVSGCEQEAVYVLHLNTKNRLIESVRSTVGLVDRSQLHAREVFRHAIKNSCSRILLAHAHPSGDPTPSAGDIEATKSLVKAGEIVGIDVLDHVIIGRRSKNRSKYWFSCREEGLLKGKT